MTITTRTIHSPLGALLLCASEGALAAVCFEGHRPAPRVPTSTTRSAAAPPTHEDERVLARASAELAEYFAGERTRFDVPTAIVLGTPFERAVWAALAEIPCGETISYTELARRVGHPSAVRAVGAANARNPLSIVVPCHRVVGAGGALTGYAGGLARKAWLLDHEARLVAGVARRAI